MIYLYLTQIRINSVSSAASVNIGTTINIVNQGEQRFTPQPPGEVIPDPGHIPPTIPGIPGYPGVPRIPGRQGRPGRPGRPGIPRNLH